MSAHRVPQADEDLIRLYASYSANSVLISKLFGGRYSDASIRVIAKRRSIKLAHWRGAEFGNQRSRKRP